MLDQASAIFPSDASFQRRKVFYLVDIGLFKEACRKAGIPMLVFEFDMFDARITPRDALQAELARFVNEVVWPRKQRKLRKATA